jgi:5-methylcytosine-specific restriction endonuclease McrA
MGIYNKKGCKGHPPWNKGLTIEDTRVARCVRNGSGRKKGSISWNKNKPAPWLIGNQHANGHIPWNKGISWSKETRDKISKTKTGKPAPWNSYPRTEEQKENLRRFRGNLASNWQGGISFNPYPLGWNKTYKEQIRYKYGYKCQLCGIPEAECSTKLDVHHIDYDKNNISETNLIALCKKCHGKTNFKRVYWVKFFKENKHEYV